MPAEDVIFLVRQSLMIVLTVVLPPTLAAVGLALGVSLFQALTQIQEQTLSFCAKFLVLAVWLLFFQSSIVAIIEFTRNLFSDFYLFTV